MSQSEDLGPSSAECHERLVDQLHTLSQVVETITYRLLELEERLIEQESQLQALDQRAGTSSQLSNGAELRFDATEERLVQLESLLNGLEPVPSAGPSRHLRPVRESHRPDPEPDQELPVSIDGPFLEEPEQAFMDDGQIEHPLGDLDALEDLPA
jgi:hypothetical protein